MATTPPIPAAQFLQSFQGFMNGAGIGVVPHSIAGGAINWMPSGTVPAHIDHLVHVPHLPEAVQDEFTFRRGIAPIAGSRYFQQEQRMLQRVASEAVSSIGKSPCSKTELMKKADRLSPIDKLVDLEEMKLPEVLSIFQAGIIYASLIDQAALSAGGGAFRSVFIYLQSKYFPIAAAIVAELAADIYASIATDDIQFKSKLINSRAYAAAGWKASLDRYPENDARPFRLARGLMNAWHDVTPESLSHLLGASIDENLTAGNRPAAGRDFLRQAYVNVERSPKKNWGEIQEAMRIGVSHLSTEGINGFDMGLARALMVSATIFADKI